MFSLTKHDIDMLTMTEEKVKSLILGREWYLGVDFEKTFLKPINLFRKRDIAKCRFAPENHEVCYLSRCFLRIEDEIQYLGDAKKVTFFEKPNLLDLDLNGPIKNMGQVNVLRLVCGKK